MKDVLLHHLTMLSFLSVLAFTGLAVAALEPRQLMHRARNQPSYVHSRDISDSDAEPCKLLSQVYEDAKDNSRPGDPVIVAVPPSVGVRCLKSVPVDKKRDLALIDYILPLISFQSTLETLADPPEEYLFPGVDVLGGVEVIRDNLKKNKYNNQYEVMVDLRSLVRQHPPKLYFLQSLIPFSFFLSFLVCCRQRQPFRLPACSSQPILLRASRS